MPTEQMNLGAEVQKLGLLDFIEENSSPLTDEDAAGVVSALLESEGIDVDDIDTIKVSGVFFAPNGVFVDLTLVGGNFMEFFIIPDGEEEEAAINFLLRDEEEFLYTLVPEFLQSHIDEEAVKELFYDSYVEMFSEDYGEDYDDETPEDRATSFLEDELSQGALEFLRVSGYEGIELFRFLILNSLVDVREVAEEAVAVDGTGHFLSAYDGEERDLEGTNYYYYRWN